MIGDPLVRSTLPVRHTSPDRARWILRDAEIRPLADAAGQLSALGWEELQKRGLYIKGRRRRLVFFFRTSSGLRIFCKGHNYRTLSESLRHRSRGWSELRNMLHAAQRGIPVPKVLGFGVRRDWGLVRQTVVLIEFLEEHRTLDDLFQNARSAEERRGYLYRCIPLVLALYRGGFNHIDPGPPNIMLHPAQPEKDVMIDFQDAPFYPKPSAEILCCQLGHLLNHFRVHFSEEELRAWLDQVLEGAGLSASEGLRDRVAAYRVAPLERKEWLQLR
jgi:hypothetical protein